MLKLQQAQEYMLPYLQKIDGRALEVEGLSWTGEQDGEILICSGVIPIWDGRAQAWALVSPAAGKHFAAIHRAVKRFLDIKMPDPFHRVEATVDVYFDPGHRWMRMLGFEPEALLHKYRPDGVDQCLYARTA